jgi:RNA polymerase sigma-70 factor (ECF subfamily)
MAARAHERDDRELAAAAGAGDRAALDALLHRHADRVHGICRRVLLDPEDALDATQEALLAVARGVARFDGQAAFTTWLYRVATNAALDEARRLARRPRAADLPERADERARALDDEVADRLDVEAALRELPAEFRAAVALRDLEGLDYATIAEVLGIPPGTVRSRIARGRAALADRLGNPARVLPRPNPQP